MISAIARWYRPILRRRGAKAIFFVATSILSERKTYWWDRIAYLVKQSPRESLRLAYPKAFEVPLCVERPHAVRLLLRLVKEHQLAQRFDLERFLNELAVAAGVRWTRDMERAFADELLMTWDQVRAMRQAGRDAAIRHKRERVPMVSLKDAKVVLIAPDQIIIPPAEDLEGQA